MTCADCVGSLSVSPHFALNGPRPIQIGRMILHPAPITRSEITFEKVLSM